MAEPGRLFIGAMRIVPKKPLSRAVRRLVAIRSKLAVRRFALRYRVALEEAEHPLESYASILDFFTRRLKPGLRPLDPDPRALLCPCDGAYLAGGPVGQGQLYQAKGRTFTLDALLAEDGAERVFRNGSYFTLYLAPKDYHRVHSPATGRIRGHTYLPGALFPVNAAAVAHVDQLFAKNERLITHMETEAFGRVDVVMVGATCVGHIKVAYDAEVKTNSGQSEIVRKIYDAPVPIARGDELGVFEMGSTVIVVVERPVASIALEPGQPVRLGMRIAEAVKT